MANAFDEVDVEKLLRKNEKETTECVIVHFSEIVCGLKRVFKLKNYFQNKKRQLLFRIVFKLDHRWKIHNFLLY